MKIDLLVVLLIYSVSSVAQSRLDEHVSITFQREPENLFFEEQHGKGTGYYLTDEKEALLALRVAVTAGGKETGVLLTDIHALEELYRGAIASQIKAMTAKGFTFSDTAKTMINELLAYTIHYTDTLGNRGAETLVLWLKGNCYLFTYAKVDTFNTEAKSRFFESLTLDGHEALAQIGPLADDHSKPLVGKSLKLLLSLITLVVLLIYLRNAKKANRRFGPEEHMRIQNLK